MGPRAATTRENMVRFCVMMTGVAPQLVEDHSERLRELLTGHNSFLFAVRAAARAHPPDSGDAMGLNQSMVNYMDQIVRLYGHENALWVGKAHEFYRVHNAPSIFAHVTKTRY